ncbi:MAG: LEPR-XLL domain-containing protein, partial [Gammaproteobacteria bacterium]|nr:LEPR-XLL domain-containing protein [Gammaproteobacteria bacterium]
MPLWLSALSPLSAVANRLCERRPREGAPIPGRGFTPLRKVVFESLEPRLLLSADLSFTALTASDLSLRQQTVNGVEYLEIVNNDATDPAESVVASQALDDTSAVFITGSAEADRVTVDLASFDDAFLVPITVTDPTAGDGRSLADALGIIRADSTWQLNGLDAGVVEAIVFSGIENLVGGSGSNTFIFEDGAMLSGSLSGGEAGSATLDFSRSSSNLKFTLSADDSVAVTNEAGTITYGEGTGINNLIGGSGDNSFVFGDGAVLEGTIDGGPGGSNLLDYSAFSDANVYVDMLTPGADETTGSASNTDGISRIQHVIGTAGNDRIFGNDEDNRLIGGGGDDTLSGAGGSDIVDGGDGDDNLSGGSEADWVIGGDGNDLLVEELNAGSVVLEDASLTADGVTDSLSGIEAVVLTGGEGDNRLDASSFTLGTVALDGSAGDDTLIGSSGDDRLSGGEGIDKITGGGGTDTLVETRDADFTLSNTQLMTGTEIDALTGITRAELTGGESGNTIDASAFTAGNVVLDGGAGDDVLKGGSGDDTLTGGEGIDAVDGGLGTDTLLEGGDGRFILTDGSLDMGEGTDEEVTLRLDHADTGGTLTGGTFTLTFEGETTIPIAHDADAQTLKQALSLLPGIASQDISVKRGRVPLATTAALSDLNDGAGVSTVRGDDLRITLTDGTTEVDIDLSEAVIIRDVLDTITAADARLSATLNEARTAINIRDSRNDGKPIVTSALNDSSAAEDLGILGSGYGATLLGDVLTHEMGPWIITFGVNQGGRDVADISVDGSGLIGASITAEINQGAEGFNNLNSVENGRLTGGISGNLMDASAFSGTAILSGSGGDDTLVGGAGPDELYGEEGNDQLSSGLGDDRVSGGEGIDLLIETRDAASITLTNTQLLMDGEVDTTSGIEQAELTGGSSANVIDASGFTGLSADTPRDYLNNGAGVRTTDISSTNLTGLEASTPLAALNAGEGVDIVDGHDLQVTLRDGTSVNIDLSGAETIKDVIDAMTDQASSLIVTLNADGSGLKIIDATTGSGDVRVSASNASGAAEDLGILGAGSGDTLYGTPFVGVSGDIRVLLSDSTEIDIDLSRTETVQDILDAITAAHEDLAAELNVTSTGIDILDASGGSATVRVTALNDSRAAEDLGLSDGIGSAAGLQGQAIIAGRVILDGDEGADTLIATSGEDTLTGGGGADIIIGGDSTDKLIETRASSDDFTLTDATLVIASEGTDDLSGIELATLTGGAGAQTIDASGFSGETVLTSGGGTDTLRGGAADDIFRVDVSNLTPGDTVTIAPGGGSDNEVVILGTGGYVSQADLEWIDFEPAAGGLQRTLTNQPTQTRMAAGGTQLIFEDEATLTILDDLSTSGMDIGFRAETINVLGATIRTDHATAAGNISIEAEHVTIGEQAILSAVTTSGDGDDGDIEISASDVFKDFTALGFANVDYNAADITIGNATITGGDVTINASAEAKDYDIDFGKSLVGDKLGTVARDVLDKLEGLSFIGGVSIATSRATIEIEEDAVVNAADFIAHSKTVVDVKAERKGAFLSVAVGIGSATSEVIIDGTITTTGSLTVRATGDNTVNVVAEGKKSYDAAVAVSVLDSDVTAYVTDKAKLTVGNDLFVMGDTVDHNRTKAESKPGKDDKLAIAAAISVEHGDTRAFLDGVADVGGDVSIDALQKKEAIQPDDQNGVEAEAGVGESSEKDESNKKSDDKETEKDKENLPFVKKIQDKVKDSVLNTLKKNETLKGLIESPTTNKVDFGAAVAVVVDINNTEARIGDGVTDDGSKSADIEADGAISVNAQTENRPSLKASSAIKNETTSKDKAQSTAKFGGSVAVGVGVYNDNADAYISGDAAVDAKEQVSVRAQTLNRIDPLELWGANLISPFLSKNTTPTHSTDAEGLSTV